MRGRSLTAWTIVVALLATPAWASAQSLGQLVRNAKSFEGEIAKLEERYLKPAILETRYKLETRFNNARVAHMLGDYEQASILLVDVVRNPKIEQFDSYRQALYLLGDSLYRERNHLAARKYLERLLDLGPGPYYQKGIVRLLEVAAKSESYEGLGRLYDKLEKGRDAELSAAVSYMRGKHLYKEDRSDRARTYLERALESDEYRFRAGYLLGVTFVAEQKYEEARSAFERLADFEVANRQQRHVRHLSQMALGRIAYEQGKLEQAVQMYKRIPRSSPHFDQALYELTWVLVSRKRYEEASRNADIFLYLSDPKPSFIPEMRLLKADLHLRIDHYDRATQSYRDVVRQFKPVERDIEDFLARQNDLQTFFDKVVEREFSGDESGFLPDSVQKWIEQSDEMKEARRTVDGVAKMRRDIRQSRRALEEIEARIASGARIKSFPQLAEGMAVGIETESELIRLREKLLEREYQLLKSEMSGGERERWRQMRSKLMDVRARYEAIPKSREEVRKRGQHIQKQFERLRTRLDRMGRKIEGQREQLTSLNEYIRQNFGKDTPDEKMKKVNDLRREIRANLKALEKRKKQIRQQIAVQQQKVGVGDEVTQREDDIRAQYRDMLKQQRTFLEQFHGRVGSSERNRIARLNEAWSALPSASSRLQRFFSRMRSIVGEKARDLQETIDRERRVLDEREKRLDQLADRSKRVASGVAYQNFVQVKQKFDEIVLRGDVGLIDVAWQRKEGKTDKINELRSERRSELNELRRSFQKMR